MESHQRHHKSIAFSLRKGRKLLRIKTNTQVLSYNRFCDPTSRKFSLPSCAHLVRAVNRQPGLPPGMTRRAPLALRCPYFAAMHIRIRNASTNRSRTNARQASLPNQAVNLRSLSAPFLHVPHAEPMPADVLNARKLPGRA